MLKNVVSTIMGKQEKTNEEIYDDAIKKIQYSIAGKDHANYIDYFQRYTHREHILEELVSLYQYLKTNKKPQQYTYISFQVFDEKTNHAETRGKRLVYDLLNHFLPQKSNTGYYLNTENIIQRKSFELNSDDEKIKGSFITVDDLDIVLKETIEIQKKFASLLNEIAHDTVLILRGTKEQLDVMFALMGVHSNFHFDFSNEYSFEEMRDLMFAYFKKEGFEMEENWEKYLRLYLSKPSEANSIKNFHYFDLLTDKLKKKALTDIKQKKSVNGKIVIKNDYFEVNLNGGDFKNLKSLKKLDKLIGMEEAKQSVKELIAYLEFNQKLQARIGKSFPLNLHMMFTGSPGTGKTTLARIIADILFELGYIKHNNLVEVDKKDLVSQWVGHTSIKTNEVIQKARGGVLFIDEAYSIVDDKFGKDAIATLIKAMEDLKTELVVILAGYQKEMEEFINSNPGFSSRIARKIHFEDYSVDELMQIYETKLEEYQIQTTEETKEKLRKIIARKRKEENFGNGRFIDNLIQDLLFKHAVNTAGYLEDDMIFTISDNDIPEKYAELLKQEKIQKYQDILNS